MCVREKGGTDFHSAVFSEGIEFPRTHAHDLSRSRQRETHIADGRLDTLVTLAPFVKLQYFFTLRVGELFNNLWSYWARAETMTMTAAHRRGMEQSCDVCVMDGFIAEGVFGAVFRGSMRRVLSPTAAPSGYRPPVANDGGWSRQAGAACESGEKRGGQQATSADVGGVPSAGGVFSASAAPSSLQPSLVRCVPVDTATNGERRVAVKQFECRHATLAQDLLRELPACYFLAMVQRTLNRMAA